MLSPLSAEPCGHALCAFLKTVFPSVCHTSCCLKEVVYVTWLTLLIFPLWKGLSNAVCLSLSRNHNNNNKLFRRIIVKREMGMYIIKSWDSVVCFVPIYKHPIKNVKYCLSTWWYKRETVLLPHNDQNHNTFGLLSAHYIILILGPIELSKHNV